MYYDALRLDAFILTGKHLGGSRTPVPVTRYHFNKDLDVTHCPKLMRVPGNPVIVRLFCAYHRDNVDVVIEAHYDTSLIENIATVHKFTSAICLQIATAAVHECTMLQ